MLPLTPPAVLISSDASVKPFLIAVPYCAAPPDSASATPSLTSTATAGATAAIAVSAIRAVRRRCAFEAWVMGSPRTVVVAARTVPARGAAKDKPVRAPTALARAPDDGGTASDERYSRRHRMLPNHVHTLRPPVAARPDSSALRARPPLHLQTMLDFYDCLANRHESTSILLAVLICAVGAYASYAIGRQAAISARGWSRNGWIAVTIVSSASSVWATQFIAMLSYHATVPMRSGFLPIPTALSYVVALVLAAVAVYARIRARSRRAVVVAGIVLGIAITSMHAAGLSAFRVAGTVSWNAPTIVVSVLIGIGFSVLASLSVVARGRPRILRPAVFFFLAVCEDHFVCMSAATVRYDPAVAMPSFLVPVHGLEFVIGLIAALIVGAALTAYVVNLRAARRRAAERRRLEGFAACAVDGLVICDGDRIVWANRSLRRLIGHASGRLVGRPLSSLLTPDAIETLTDDREVDVVLGFGANATPARATRKPIDLDGFGHTVITFRDQRERLRIEAEMRRLAGSDPLTGLANRARFNEALAHLLSSRLASEREFALVSIDLDRFKQVNDTHGLAAGDALLARVGGRLHAAVHTSVLIARTGGDQFAIIVSGRERNAVPSLAARLVEVFSRPFVIDGRIHEIGASVGIAFAPTDGEDADTLMRNADLALYRAKDDGGATYRLFEADMDARMRARGGLELALRRASARCEFELYYQPQVDARTGRYDGAEALIRWNHPELGLVPPSDFIPVAEETNLIVAIGEWVLHAACTEAATWPSHLKVAVNLSALQFRDPHLLTIVRSALDASGLPAHRLELEVTESALIDDEATVLALLTRFKALGVRLALDDFGTGYSSLSHLRRFPFDKIKIDRSFVSMAPDDRDSATIVRAVISLGASLGLATTAEGVETESQRRFVVDEGCDQIQGYLVSRALPVGRLPTEFRSTSEEASSCPSFDFSTAATAT